jgi:membrane-associated phospholipid phosphatase
MTAPAVGVFDRVVLGRLGHRGESTARAASAVSTLTRGGTAWHGASLVLLATRRPAAIRVAGAGSIAWGATSAVVAVLKRLTGRRRPRLAIGPSARTSSMPSSHTATGIAYATAASIQHPAAGALLMPAALVGWARLETRRHFPTDVIVGAGVGLIVGAGIGIAIRRAATNNRRRTPADDRPGGPR